ncbi:MAG: sigma 54-interacting transcriptional regulator [Deltaproteobacteria bacterium]|nr:sigma 54-interacting transcriptional regulator [Deltaproteobacteria bacterium]
MKKKSLLFICTENSARSQMAEGFAKNIAPDGVLVLSAGTQPASETHKMAISVMNDHGIDISSQKPKKISALKRYRFDLVITLCSSARENCSPLAGSPPRVHWNLDDPAVNIDTKKETKKAFRECADKIKALVSDLFNRGYFEAFATQKKNTENILNHLSQGLIAHDLERKIFFFSEGAERLTGLSEIDVIGKDCHDVFIPRICGDHCSFCDGSDYSGSEIKCHSTINPEMDGNRKELEITVVPLKDENGKMDGVIACLRDRTEFKKISDALAERNSFSSIIGRSAKMIDVFEQIKSISGYDMPVSIFGKTGTGKEVIANAIHDESIRRDNPFVPINCGALPEGLVESELFGHVKGSFSGAVRDKKGRFELADGGTIFLDEVAELPKHIQVKLLRFLQEGVLEKVGSEKNIKVNVRIISATNKDLKKEVQKGNFREDLYYRIKVIPVTLPPLQDRKSDIPLLVEHFINKMIKTNKKNQKNVSKDAVNVLMNYSWPGNVRELENVIQFAVIKSTGNVITPKDLPMELTENIDISLKRGPSKKLDTNSVKTTLVRTGGNKAKAAKILDVGRATLYRFINDHPEVVPDDL